MIFKSTSHQPKKGTGHYHVFLSPDPRQAPPPSEAIICGITEDHDHLIEFNPEEGAFNLTPSGKDGHSHIASITDVYKPQKIKEDSKEDTLDEYLDCLKQARDYESSSLRKADKAYRYYNQSQWDEQVKQALDSSDRPHLTFDQISPNTDKLIGHFLQDRPDLTVFPVDKGDEVGSDILSAVLKHIMKNSNDSELSEMTFTDLLVAGRGVNGIYIDYSKDIQGDIIVDYEPYCHVLAGPHTRRDMTDCENLFRVRILTKRQLEMQYPDSAKDVIDARFIDEQSDEDGVEAEMHEWVSNPGRLYEKPEAKEVKYEISDNKKLIRFLVIDWFRKSYFKEYIFATQTGIEPPTRMKSSDVSQLRRSNVGYADRMNFTVERVTVSNRQILDRFDTGFDFFPYSVYYGKKTQHGWTGKVYGALDQQDEINKRASQTTDIINRMAGYNWIYGADTFSPEDERKFLETSSQAGTAHKVADMGNIPHKIEGTKIPMEVLQLEQNALQRLDMYFGGSLNAHELNKAGSRGLMLQQRIALVINEIFFKHYEDALKDLGKKLIRFVQRYYSPQKILRIIRSAPTDEQEMAYQQMQDVELLKVLSEIDYCKYDATVGVVKWSPTFREAQFENLKELAMQGMAIPPSFLIEMSSIPNKSKLMETISSQSQASSEMEKVKYATEALKTLPDQYAPLIIEVLTKAGMIDPQATQQMQGAPVPGAPQMQ